MLGFGFCFRLNYIWKVIVFSSEIPTSSASKYVCNCHFNWVASFEFLLVFWISLLGMVKWISDTIDNRGVVVLTLQGSSLLIQSRIDVSCSIKTGVIITWRKIRNPISFNFYTSLGPTLYTRVPRGTRRAVRDRIRGFCVLIFSCRWHWAPSLVADPGLQSWTISDILRWSLELAVES